MKPKKKKLPLSDTLFALLYTAVLGAAWLLALPPLALLAFKQKYRRSIPARFFLWKNPPLPEQKVWFHACSFGETRALKPLLERFGAEAVLTVTTQTGFDEGRRMCGQVRYLPFEPLLWFWLKPQKVLVVMEAELWFLLFFLARKRGAKTILLNARISDRSYGRYRKFVWLYRRIFAQIDEVYAQSEIDKKRLEALGAGRVRVTGNIKLAELPVATKKYKKPEGIVITAASTHEGEEGGIVEAFLRFKKNHPSARLLLVPRHPERFEKVAKTVAPTVCEAGLSFSRWSVSATLDSDVVLVDTMGELVNLYAISDIVVLGGAFVPVGGHNPAEVIPFGCRLISGHEIFNQRAMFAAVEGALFCDLSGLEERLHEALGAEPLRAKTPVSLEPIVKGIRDVV